MPVVIPKGIVLNRDEGGTLRIRADFDVEILEPIHKWQTVSRQMENVALSALVTSISENYDAIFALLSEAIPPE